MANSLEVELGRTGLTGIHVNYKGHYRAEITVNGRSKHIGTWYTLEEAVHARIHALSGAGMLPSSVRRGRPARSTPPKRKGAPDHGRPSTLPALVPSRDR